MGRAQRDSVAAIVSATRDEAQELKELERLGPTAATERAARVYLIRALRDPRPAVADRAANILGKAGSAVVPGLVAALADTALGARVMATYALGLAGREAKEALPVLTRQLGGESDSLANISDWAISQIEPRGSGFVPLLRTLRYGNPFDQAGAARQLSLFGEASTDAIPLLVRGLGGSDPLVGQAAGEALVSIGPRASLAVEAVLSSDNPAARFRAVLVLSRIRSSDF